MKKITFLILLLLAFKTLPVFAVESNASYGELLKEVEQLKAKVQELEKKINDMAEKTAGVPEEETMHHHSVKSLDDRVSRIEQEIEKGIPEHWSKRINFSGLIEVEGTFEKNDPEDGGRTENSDISLATVDMGVDINVAEHVIGHGLFQCEEGVSEGVIVDEAFIMFENENIFPGFITAGRMYVPFGNFESHFISDPPTVTLGETRESAIQFGIRNELNEISLTAFNGDINRKDNNDHINNFVVSGHTTLPEDALPGIKLTSGIAYIRNIADSDGLQDVITDPATGNKNTVVGKNIGGLSIYISATFNDTIHYYAEYIRATDNFTAGELDFDSGKSFQPEVWNFELAWGITDKLECAIKYEGSDNLGYLEPERQVGGVIIYNLFSNTSLAFEYLHGIFENNDKRDMITSQIAISF